MLLMAANKEPLFPNRTIGNLSFPLQRAKKLFICPGGQPVNPFAWSHLI